jgi:hypothetical protein
MLSVVSVAVCEVLLCDWHAYDVQDGQWALSVERLV